MPDSRIETDNPRRRSLPLLHEHLANDLKKRIVSGDWAAGIMPSRKEIAEEYGISLGTVQLAVGSLLDSGILRAESRKGTFIALRQPLEDAPSSPSQINATGVGTLGILSQHDAAQLLPLHAWDREVFRALEGGYSEAGGAVRFFPFRNTAGRELHFHETISRVIEQEIDALAIVDLYDSNLIAEGVTMARNPKRIPIVYISGSNMRVPCFHVFYDHYNAGYLAAQRLLESGRSDLLFVTTFTDFWVEERIAGASAAVRIQGNDSARIAIFPDNWQDNRYSHNLYPARQQSYDAILTLGEKGLRDRGVIAPNDDAAYGMIEAAQNLGMKPGRDFGLVGFDDDNAARDHDLTSVRPPMREMGEEAARLLIRACKGERASMQICIRPLIISRGSTLSRP